MTSCRACKSKSLYMFLPLGLHPLANGFLEKDRLTESEPLFPLDVYACLDCGLIQLQDSVPQGFFRNYVYVPSAASIMHDHFAGFADALAGRYLDLPDPFVIDIGCNDGLFLKCLKDRGLRTLGIDPATNIIELAREKGLEIINEYFNPKIAIEVKEKYGPAAAVVTTNTFHHIDDLDSFTEGVRILLGDNGIFVIELPYALEIVKQNEFDGFYHEHLSQFTVKSLVDLFQRFDMEVFHVDLLEIHGGSMRAFARRKVGSKPVSPIVSELLARETESGLLSASTYDAFRGRVEENKGTLVALLQKLKAEGKKLAGYGASARGNTLLNYCGIGTDLLDYMVDNNSLKQGLYSPGMHIPVFAPERIMEEKPDYVLIVAWNFSEEIINQQAEYSGLGGNFILPIPEPRIIAGAGIADPVLTRD